MTAQLDIIQTLVIHFGSKKDAQEKFLEVILIQNSYKVRYSELNICMHNSYVNGKYRCTKTLSDALNVIFNWKGGRGLLHSNMNPAREST